MLSHLTDNNSVSSVFSINSKDKAIKADLTGDGKEDILYITTNKEKYSLQINTDMDSLYLEPSSKLNTVGNVSSTWPLKVKLFDVSRDKIPEIFVQGSINNTPVQHMFIYSKGKFEDIFCNNTNNILGFLDCTNNKTPKIVSGKLQGANFTFSNYILIQNKLEQYNYEATDTFMGKDTIAYFISVINSLSQENVQLTPEIFDDKIPSSSIGVISSLPYLANNFVLQDAVFNDTRSDKNGNPTHVQWILNFRGNDIKTNELKNFTLKLNLKTFDYSKDKYYYKIFSIALLNK